jgi:hypothetical protein
MLLVGRQLAVLAALVEIVSTAGILQVADTPVAGVVLRLDTWVVVVACTVLPFILYTTPL